MRASRLLATAVVALCSALSLPARAEPAPGRWDEVLAFREGESWRDAGVDAHGEAWVLTTGALRYWDATGFRAVEAPLTDSLSDPGRLVGGPDRGLFLATAGKVYSLSSEGVRYEVDYYAPSRAQSVYVAPDGRLMQFGASYISPDLRRPSTRREASLRYDWRCTWEDGPSVHILSASHLYTVGPGDAVTEVTCDLPREPNHVVSCLPWGPGKALALGVRSPGIVGIDTASGALFDVPDLVELSGGPDVYRMLAAMPDGTWLLRPAGRDEPLYRVSPGGPPQMLPNSADIPAVFGWQLSTPEARAVGKDGGLWINGGGRGLLNYRDGAIRTWGWRDGIRIGHYERVLADGAGTVFAMDGRGVYVFRPDGFPPPLPAGYELWTEVRAETRPAPDLRGGVWILLSDRPGSASHWDGERWTDIRVPFDRYISDLITDDRGHLLAVHYWEDGRAYDVSLEGVRSYDSVQAAVQAAVADGARRFRGDGIYPCIYADGKGSIWIARRFPPALYHFDGTQWREVKGMASFVYPSAEHGVLLGWGGPPTFWLAEEETGQTRPVYFVPEHLVLGPNGVQPLEEPLVRAAPDLYLPVDWTDETCTLRRPEPGADGVRYVPGDAIRLVGDVETLPAPEGGLWLNGPSGGPFHILAGRAVACDFSRTPLRGTALPFAVYEDRGHNVWAWGTATFMKRLSDFRVRLGEAPARVGRALDVEVGLDLPGLAPGEGRVFYRVDDGPWLGGDPPGPTRVRFWHKGEHRVEFLGMDPVGGATPHTAALAVEAAMPLPDTRLTAAGPFRLDDVAWRPPVEAVPTAPEEKPALLYRIDDGPWQPLPAVPLLLDGVSPGAHVAEFAAEEEGPYRDATPLRVEFTYAPDFGRIVGRRMDALLGPEPVPRSAALRELKAAGPGAVEALRRRLAQVGPNAEALERLRKVKEQIEQDREPPGPEPPREGPSPRSVMPFPSPFSFEGPPSGER